MHNDKESPFTLTLLDDDLSLQVVQFSGREALNRPYRFDIEVLGLAPAMHLERLLQQPALLKLGQGQGIHGVLHSASREHRGPHHVGYKLALVPALLALDRKRCRRVFTHLSVPMILRQLLEEHDLPDSSYRFELTTGHYPPRPFCIQYEESDLALLQRLCEEEGIHYHFEHHRDRHVLVLADDCLSFPQEPLLMPYHRDAADGQLAISELHQRHVSPPLVPCLTQEQHHSDQRSRRHLERLRCLQVQIHGQGNHCQLRSARIVQVAGHPLPGFNDQWLVTQARHQGQQGSILAQDTHERAPSYRNQFSAIPWSTVFRPQLQQARPSIPGYQPARVCGPAGQAAARNECGRIQVRLWPVTHTDSEDVGLWLPVTLPAMDEWVDTSRLPRAGSDVWVSFLDSDPDRPILCVGMGELQKPRPPCPIEPRNDARLLLDWLINRPQSKP